MIYIILTFLLIKLLVKLRLLFLVENRSMTFSISRTISWRTCMSAMLFNLSKTMVLLGYVFNRLIAENDHLQVHVVISEVPRIFKKILILLNPLNGMHFNVLEILSRRQSSLSSQYVLHKSSSASNALGLGKSSLKRSTN